MRRAQDAEDDERIDTRAGVLNGIATALPLREGPRNECAGKAATQVARAAPTMDIPTTIP